MQRATAAIFAAVAAALVASPSGVDARVERGAGLASKKAERAAPPPLLATLVQTHTDERVPLDEATPTGDRFSALLADRVTGERHAFDPRLLDLLRALARKYPAARIELVSGYRSAKLNETMRKKGHHVASHSQHSLGHACDFRIVPAGADKGVDPRILERDIRDLGWDGGVGVYPLSGDWFVHADVGKHRHWDGN
ncbi:MAG: putative exported protein [Labilithrix sp.]|nr:putative exported protein [Labilithrix sp.]